jgi:hypothetical protein
VPDRLATQLLRLARDPGSGRLRHPGPLATGLRAALFTDLILTGRVSEADRGPHAQEPAESGDRILDAVQRAVAHRPDVPWWRWFRHVRADRVALVDELVQAGRWTPHHSGLGAAYKDRDADEALERAETLRRVVTGDRAPADSRQAVLGVLTVMCGSIDQRPHPRAVRLRAPRGRDRSVPSLLRNEWHPLIEAAASTGEPGADLLAEMLFGASRLLKRPLRRGG